MYSILFSDTAKKQLLKLERSIQERIGEAIERIKVRPDAFVDRLVGEKLYKFRVGDYRLILNIDRGILIILVIEIGHRSGVYK